MLRSLAIGLLVIAATDAAAVTSDLQCYKVANQTLKKLKAVVDLNAPRVGVAAGCKLSRAKLYCAPAEATVQSGSVFDGKRPGTIFEFDATRVDDARICYGVKCKKPAGRAATQSATDRFGDHEFTKLTTSMLCAQVAPFDLTPTGFGLKSRDVEVTAQSEFVSCFYFRTLNTAPLAIKKWTSHLPPQAQQIVVYLTDVEIQPPGTEVPGCNLGGTTPTWEYSADQPDSAFEFPADDGSGTPVGQIIGPAHSGFIWIHYVNTAPEPVTTHVEVSATVFDAGTDVTRADSYVTYDGSLDLPAMSPYFSDFKPCNVPAGAKFFSLSTQSYKQSVHTLIEDDHTILFESTDFAHPGSVRSDTPPFLTFASGKLTYECQYMNPTSQTIQAGPSPVTDELCMAIGFFFPSTAPQFCYNTFVSPLSP